jgi:hypothetical protein
MRRLLQGSFLFAALACRPAGGADSRRATTERERDSVLGASALPGAQGVSGALRVSDSAAARRAREDSIARSQP